MTGIASDIRLSTVLPGEPDRPVELTAAMERFGIPGVSAVAIRGNEIAWANGWGLRNAESEEPVTPETLFQAGSVSKPVAALVALRLVAEGAVSLDTSVNELLTSWKVPRTGDWQPAITMRQLLSHTAGLTMHGFPGYAADVETPSLIDVLDGRGNTSPIWVRTLPGLQYSYSGGGYLVLQQLLIDLTGRPFPEIARELVFEPLGMTRSTYEQPLPRPLWDSAASGHRTGAKPVAGRWHTYPEMTAGGLWTTAGDLARFLIAIRQAWHGVEGGILPQSLAQEMLTVQAPNSPIGLGLKFGGAGPAFWFGHGGDDQGFVCWTRLFAHTGQGAVVMTNSDHGLVAIEAIFEAIAREDTWPREAEPTQDVSIDQDTVTGTFELTDGRTLHVNAGVRPDQLLLVMPGQDPLTFTLTAGCWRAEGLAAELGFSDDGSTLVIHQDAMYVQDVEARRVR